MKPALSICLFAVLSLLAIPSAHADIAPPKPTPTPTQQPGKVVLHTSLEIVPDAKAWEARLQIRQSDLQELRAALNNESGTRSIAMTIAHSPARTIVAGLFLFISVSLAGVWFARSKHMGLSIGRGQKTAAVALFAVATVLAAAIITRGNAGPPGFYRWKNLPSALKKGEATQGGVDIEILPDDANVRTGMKLIIPLRDQGKPGEEE